MYAHLSDDEKVISHSRKISEGKYEVVLSPRTRNLSALRHELYHIADGHCDTEMNLLLYLFWQEPQVTIYEATGLKL